MKALVFGGRSPIALALCRQLADSGSQVHLVTRRNDQALESKAENAGIAAVHEVNLSDSSESVALTGQLDPPKDPLTQVAFLHRYRETEHDELAQYRVEVLTPAAILAQLAARQRPHPCAVLLTSSPAGRIIVGDQAFQYHASKAATNQLVRYAAVRYAPLGIRVNALCPGSFVYKERAAEYYSRHPEVMRRVAELVPAGRMATVDEVAAVGLFLLSPQSGYMYGQILEVDGGVGLMDPATI